MRISLHWLSSYISLPESPQEIARLLTEHAFETTLVPKAPRLPLASVRVGEITGLRKHPNADRLSLAKVRTSTREEQEVVCGAPHLRVGMRIALASSGARVRTKEGNEEVLKPTVIRGVESRGMICTEWELGLSEQKELLEFPPDVRIGTPLSELFPEDTFLDVDVLPDRAPDASSYLGIARELGAILRRKTHLPLNARQSKGTSAPPFAVSVEDPAQCPRFITAVLENIRPQPSPFWLQARLRAAGIRPHNLIVDVTNYVMLEVGQPTHAFDARAVGRTLAVEEVKKTSGASIILLDDTTRTLPKGTLVIASDGRPLDIAGVMGGKESSIQEDTERIVFTAAFFQPATVRKTMQSLGIRTAASDLFSRGVTAYTVEAGALRVIDLLQTIGGARLRAFKDVHTHRGPGKPLTLLHERLEGMLGIPVAARTVRSVLQHLQYAVTPSKDGYRVMPPPFRADVSLPEDVIEDVGRMIGYNELPSPLPLAPLVPMTLPDHLQDVRKVQDALRAVGWMETYSYSFMPEEEARALLLDAVKTLELVNPVQQDHRRLRTSLLPNLLHAAWSAVKKESPVRMFEVGHVYPGTAPEETHIGGILVRRSEEHTEHDFYEVKGTVEHLLAELQLPETWFDPTDPVPADSFLATWDTRASAEVKIDKETVGFVGEISRDVLQKLNIRGRVVAFELNLSRIEDIERVEHMYHPPLPFPTVHRDMSLLLPLQILVDQVRQAVTDMKQPLLRDVHFVDMYEEASGGKRSVTFRVTYGSPERTLRDEEVNKAHAELIAFLEERLGVEART